MSDEKRCGQGLGHIRIVELGEAEGCLAELTVLFLRVSQPFHQADLVNELDAATTFARVKERVIWLNSLAMTDPTGVHVFETLLPLVQSAVVHEVGKGRHGGRARRARHIHSVKGRRIDVQKSFHQILIVCCFLSIISKRGTMVNARRSVGGKGGASGCHHRLDQTIAASRACRRTLARWLLQIASRGSPSCGQLLHNFLQSCCTFPLAESSCTGITKFTKITGKSLQHRTRNVVLHCSATMCHR